MPRRKIADRIQWLEANWIMKDGARWSLQGREWIMEQMIRPMYGWRICSTAEQPDQVCARCAKFLGRLVEWSPAIEDVIERDHSLGHDGTCAGLYMVKIQVVVVCVNRRGGKTGNSCALAAERIAHEEFIDVMMFAAAGQQAEVLFTENLVNPLSIIEDEGGDVDDFVVTGSKVRFPELHSQFEIVDSSKRSVTGRGKDVLICEEARDVDGVLFVKALPSILDRNFLRCENGHRFTFGVEDQVKRRKWCPVCQQRLEPNFGTVLIVSSGGVIDDSPAFKWFADLVTMLELAEKPRPMFHLFRDDDVANPAIAEESKAVMEAFEDVPGISDLIRAERTNAFSQRGEVFITSSDYRRIIDPKLAHADGCIEPCVMFFDTSLKKDFLSLAVIAMDDGTAPFWQRPPKAGPLPPWTLAFTPSRFMWDPKVVFRAVDGDIVRHEEVAWQLLQPILPNFPNVREIWVDVRGQLWAHRLVEMANASKTPWGRKFLRYQHGSKEKEVKRNAWKIYEQRVTGRTLRTFSHPRVIKELEGLMRKKNTDGEWDVIDRSRKLMHADMLSGEAALCGRIWELKVQRTTAAEINERIAGESVRGVLDKYSRPGGKYTRDSW